MEGFSHIFLLLQRPLKLIELLNTMDYKQDGLTQLTISGKTFLASNNIQVAINIIKSLIE